MEEYSNYIRYQMQCSDQSLLLMHCCYYQMLFLTDQMQGNMKVYVLILKLTLRNLIYERLREEEYGNKLATDISGILQDTKVGRKRKEEEHILDYDDIEESA